MARDPADRARDLLARLQAVRQDAEATWTPGQALGEIAACLRRAESFTGSRAAAEQVLARMRWLTRVLLAADGRARAAGLYLSLGGLLSAIARHDAVLASAGTVQAPAVRDARTLVQLEISGLLPPPDAGL